MRLEQLLVPQRSAACRALPTAGREQLLEAVCVPAAG